MRNELIDVSFMQKVIDNCTVLYEKSPGLRCISTEGLSQ